MLHVSHGPRLGAGLFPRLGASLWMVCALAGCLTDGSATATGLTGSATRPADEPERPDEPPTTPDQPERPDEPPTPPEGDPDDACREASLRFDQCVVDSGCHPLLEASAQCEQQARASCEALIQDIDLCLTHGGDCDVLREQLGQCFEAASSGCGVQHRAAEACLQVCAPLELERQILCERRPPVPPGADPCELLHLALAACHGRPVDLCGGAPTPPYEGPTPPYDGPGTPPDGDRPPPDGDRPPPESEQPGTPPPEGDRPETAPGGPSDDDGDGAETAPGDGDGAETAPGDGTRPGEEPRDRGDGRGRGRGRGHGHGPGGPDRHPCASIERAIDAVCTPDVGRGTR